MEEQAVTWVPVEKFNGLWSDHSQPLAVRLIQTNPENSSNAFFSCKNYTGLKSEKNYVINNPDKFILLAKTSAGLDYKAGSLQETGYPTKAGDADKQQKLLSIEKPKATKLIHSASPLACQFFHGCMGPCVLKKDRMKILGKRWQEQKDSITPVRNKYEVKSEI